MKVSVKVVFYPKIISCLKNYTKAIFVKDLMAGIIVGIVGIARHNILRTISWYEENAFFCRLRKLIVGILHRRSVSYSFAYAIPIVVIDIGSSDGLSCLDIYNTTREMIERVIVIVRVDSPSSDISRLSRLVIVRIIGVSCDYPLSSGTCWYQVEYCISIVLGISISIGSRENCSVGTIYERSSTSFYSSTSCKSCELSVSISIFC